MEQGKIDILPFHKWVVSDGTLWTLFYRCAEAYLLRFPGLADFEISGDGLVVRARPALGISGDTVRHLYLNQVLPLALSRRGKFVYHASAVETPRGALAFMGESGRGKSTLAASLSKAGYPLLTDDGLQLQSLANAFWVQPSLPSIRLWDDSRRALMNDSAMLAPPLQHTAKARILADESLIFSELARPLERLYFLGDGSSGKVAIDSVSPSEALILLVNHSFLLDVEARDLIAAHFDELARLVAMPIFFRLDYPRAYEYLPAVHAAILQHAHVDLAGL